ncbi:MAG: PhoH family protein [Hyphomicrobiaceae bacterium]
MPAVRGSAITGAGKSGKPQKSDRRITIPFEDNRAAAELFGEYDANLAKLEERLGIEAVAHGNVVTLNGPEASCELARDVLEELYGRAAAGEAIRPGDVDGAIRHALGEALSEPKARSDEGTGGAQGKAQIRTRKKLITARTPLQSAYIRALEQKDLVFAAGPAGTGKTYLAVAFAAACWDRAQIDRIILSRPAVEAGERLGFLPGDMREKVDPYLRPLYDALYDVLPPEKVERGLETGAIEIAPLAFMRGRTLANAFVILDEAQNCTSMQMKMFLTRLGEGSRMVVTGDPTQIDLPNGQISGLPEAINLLGGIDDIATIRFTQKDVVRRELVAKIVAAYEGATE